MTYLFWGFAAMWVAIAAYVGSLATRQRRLAEDIEMLDEVLEATRRDGTE